MNQNIFNYIITSSLLGISIFLTIFTYSNVKINTEFAQILYERLINKDKSLIVLPKHYIKPKYIDNKGLEYEIFNNLSSLGINLLKPNNKKLTFNFVNKNGKVIVGRFDNTCKFVNAKNNNDMLNLYYDDLKVSCGEGNQIKLSNQDELEGVVYSSGLIHLFNINRLKRKLKPKIYFFLKEVVFSYLYRDNSFFFEKYISNKELRKELIDEKDKSTTLYNYKINSIKDFSNYATKKYYFKINYEVQSKNKSIIENKKIRKKILNIKFEKDESVKSNDMRIKITFFEDYFNKIKKDSIIIKKILNTFLINVFNSNVAAKMNFLSARMPTSTIKEKEKLIEKINNDRIIKINNIRVFPTNKDDILKIKVYILNVLNDIEKIDITMQKIQNGNKVIWNIIKLDKE